MYSTSISDEGTYEVSLIGYCETGTSIETMNFTVTVLPPQGYCTMSTSGSYVPSPLTYSINSAQLNSTIQKFTYSLACNPDITYTSTFENRTILPKFITFTQTSTNVTYSIYSTQASDKGQYPISLIAKELDGTEVVMNFVLILYFSSTPPYLIGTLPDITVAAGSSRVTPITNEVIDADGYGYTLTATLLSAGSFTSFVSIQS